MTKPKVIAFDLDGTLALSKSPITPRMAELVSKLLDKYNIIVISGGAFPQFEKQFLSNLHTSEEGLANLTLMPQSGGEVYAYAEHKWIKQISHNISKEEQEQIISSINSALTKVSWPLPREVFGDVIEVRGSQVSYSALGQNAPLDKKRGWDSDIIKRKELANIIRPTLLLFDVRIGGTTTIDITHQGVNKRSAIVEYLQANNISNNEITYIGDALYPGGNDSIVKDLISDTREVAGPDETTVIIEELLYE